MSESPAWLRVEAGQDSQGPYWKLLEAGKPGQVMAMGDDGVMHWVYPPDEDFRSALESLRNEPRATVAPAPAGIQSEADAKGVTS